LLSRQEDAQLRVASAQGLAGRANALPALAERLRLESSANVRLELIRSVGLVQTPAAMNALAELAQSQHDLLARKTAIQELGRSFGASALPVLSRILADANEDIRKSAVTAMARVKTDDSLALLQRTADTDPSATVSEAATAALVARQ
jgi:HEAT repeat protein